MLKSAKNTFKAVDRNMHAFATDWSCSIGPCVTMDRKRRTLASGWPHYVRQAVKGTWGVDGAQVLDDRAGERLLEGVGMRWRT